MNKSQLLLLCCGVIDSKKGVFTIAGAKIPYRYLDQYDVLLLGLSGDAKPLKITKILDKLKLEFLRRQDDLLYYKLNGSMTLDQLEKELK